MNKKLIGGVLILSGVAVVGWFLLNRKKPTISATQLSDIDNIKTDISVKDNTLTPQQQLALIQTINPLVSLDYSNHTQKDLGLDKIDWQSLDELFKIKNIDPNAFSNLQSTGLSSVNWEEVLPKLNYIIPTQQVGNG